MDDRIIKKNIMYELLGMIVANMKNYTKISWNFVENKDVAREHDENSAVQIDMDFLKKHKVELDVNLETMICEKKLQNAVYSYRFYGDTNSEKISMVITFQPGNYSINEIKVE